MEKLPSATDQSSYVVQCDITDEDGNPTTPISATWTLTNSVMATVNNRKQVPISPLATTIYIALSGQDLVAGTTMEENLRYLVVEGTYTSTVTGGTLPVKKGFKFYIDDLPSV